MSNTSANQSTILVITPTIIPPIVKFLALATPLAASSNPNRLSNHDVTDKSPSFTRFGKKNAALNRLVRISEALSNLNILPNHSLAPVTASLTVFITKLSLSSSVEAHEKRLVNHVLTLVHTSL